MVDYSMVKKNSSKWFLMLVSSVFLFFIAWWFLINYTTVFEGDAIFETFAASYGLLALIAGLFGLYVFKRWGGFGSLIGKVIGFFSLGLLAQEFGQLAYSYYSIVLGVEVPYPSIGDLGFFGSIPLYILGAYYLVKISMASVNSGRERLRVGLQVIFVPTAMLVISYLFLLKDYEIDYENMLGTALDFAYPLCQAIYVSLALIAFFYTAKMVNGIMHKRMIFLLVALVVQYLADFVFLYKAHRETYVTGGVTDLLYLVAYFLMALAIINLNVVFEKLKNGKVIGETVNGQQ